MGYDYVQPLPVLKQKLAVNVVLYGVCFTEGQMFLHCFICSSDATQDNAHAKAIPHVLQVQVTGYDLSECDHFQDCQLDRSCDVADVAGALRSSGHVTGLQVHYSEETESDRSVVHRNIGVLTS